MSHETTEIALAALAEFEAGNLDKAIELLKDIRAGEEKERVREAERVLELQVNAFIREAILQHSLPAWQVKKVIGATMFRFGG